jgi:hypothetical protein
MITRRDCGRPGGDRSTTWLPDQVLARDRTDKAIVLVTRPVPVVHERDVFEVLLDVPARKSRVAPTGCTPSSRC